MSTAPVDVRRKAKTVVVRLRVHDTVPVSTVTLWVATTHSRRIAGRGTLVAGTATDGTWRVALTMRRFIRAGRYRIVGVSLWDVGRGHAAYGRSWDGWPRPFLARSYTDRVAPTASGFRVSTRAVDTRTSARAVTLRVIARDALSGVASVRVRAVGVDPLLESTLWAYRGFDVTLARSASHKHLWTGRIVVPRWVGMSTLRMRLLLKDRRQSLRSYSTQALAGRGWQSTLRITSLRDRTPPALVGVSFAPASVDARAHDVRVNFTYRVTDLGSGPSPSIALRFESWEGWLTGVEESVVTSITGSATDRTYRGYAIVTRCGRAVQTLNAYVVGHDNSGNTGAFGRDELVALGLPSELQVRQVDAWAPSVTALPVAVGGPITMTFSEPVLVASPMSATVTVTVNGLPATGSWECRNGVNDVVVCDADGASVVTASFTPTRRFVANDRVELGPRRTGPRGAASTTWPASP